MFYLPLGHLVFRELSSKVEGFVSGELTHNDVFEHSALSWGHDAGAL